MAWKKNDIFTSKNDFFFNKANVKSIHIENWILYIKILIFSDTKNVSFSSKEKKEKSPLEKIDRIYDESEGSTTEAFSKSKIRVIKVYIVKAGVCL